jgi:hypothetical protein
MTWFLGNLTACSLKSAYLSQTQASAIQPSATPDGVKRYSRPYSATLLVRSYGTDPKQSPSPSVKGLT